MHKGRIELICEIVWHENCGDKKSKLLFGGNATCLDTGLFKTKDSSHSNLFCEVRS